MKYALFIYEDESIYGPGKNGPAIQQIVSKHMAFNQELGLLAERAWSIRSTSLQLYANVPFHERIVEPVNIRFD